MNAINSVEKNLAPFMQQVVNHPVFTSIHSVHDLKIFSQYHVFAVWDFMSLVKKLQAEITCVKIPWVPSNYPTASHFINKIISEEESDLTADGRYISHFNYYIEAMEECGADTAPICQFVSEIRKGTHLADALEAHYVPIPAKHFVQATFSMLKQDVHQVLSSFVFGREDLMAKVFDVILKNLCQDSNKTEKFCYYFKRHIELDEGSHAPEGKKLLTLMCGDDPQKWKAVEETAIFALQARRALLDSIYSALQKKPIEELA